MKKIRQILACIGIIIIIGLVIVTFILNITGSSLGMGMLILTMGVSISIWVILWFLQLMEKRNAEKGATEQGGKRD